MERVIQAFNPVEYWSIEADLEKQVRAKLQRTKKDRFRAALVQIRGEKFECSRGEQATSIVKELESATYIVGDVRRKEVQRNPSPPFITSTMQQEASRKIGFTAKRTMAVAQQLYEGLPVGEEGSIGLITYMRTDSDEHRRGRPGRSARLHRRALWAGLRTAHAAPVQDQGKGRPGGARGHPADICAPRARQDQGVPDAGAVQALRPGLEALRCQPDVGGRHGCHIS